MELINNNPLSFYLFKKLTFGLHARWFSVHWWSAFVI